MEWNTMALFLTVMLNNQISVAIMGDALFQIPWQNLKLHSFTLACHKLFHLMSSLNISDGLWFDCASIGKIRHKALGDSIE